jgi:hypothetical protein
MIAGHETVGREAAFDGPADACQVDDESRRRFLDRKIPAADKTAKGPVRVIDERALRTDRFVAHPENGEQRLAGGKTCS